MMTINGNGSFKCPQCGAPVAGSEEMESHWAESHMRRTTALRRMINGSGMVVAPFCMNAFLAKIAQQVGFKAIYMTGFGTAAEKGYPDVGLLTQTEMVQNAKYICRAVDIPLICDSDTGYGNPLNVWRTVREYEDVGVAGIHLEDQVFPKKCGFFEGKDVIPMEEHVQKIKAALDARQDKDFVIIARCDALAVNGWEDTVRRCRAYSDAGADVVFVDGVKTQEDLTNYATNLADLPRLYNGILLPPSEIEKMGFKIMITVATLGIVYTAVKQAFQQLAEEGILSTGDIRPGTADIVEMLGLPRIYEMEQTYSAG